MFSDPLTWVIIVASAFSAAAFALLLFRQTGATRFDPRRLPDAEESRPVFLFDDEAIIDMTEPAREQFARFPRQDSDWKTLVSGLANRFPTMSNDLAALAHEGVATLESQIPDDTTEIVAEWWDGTVRIELRDSAGLSPDIWVDRQCLAAMEEELALLRHAVNNAPVAIWQANAEGGISWANRNYMNIAPGDASWPPDAAFANLEPHPYDTPGAVRRLQSDISDGWFDVQTSAFGDTQVGFAVTADAEVQAESARQEFIQTISKTFAHLSVGLAIFDRNRQLVLFNPALTDLLTLPVDFLSSRPTLFTFLDRLRDRRMMPEPKDYKSWRDQITALESAAKVGTYQESWSLPGGQTYRVIGRPYPDGAIALQFEDITPEISLTRNFRAELELGQTVLDAMPQAIAVFSADGVLTMSNAAYADLWGSDPSTTLGEISTSDALCHWMEKSEESPLWHKVERFLCKLGDRNPICGSVCLENGERVDIELRALPGGANIMMFRTARAQSKKSDHSVDRFSGAA